MLYSLLEFLSIAKGTNPTEEKSPKSSTTMRKPNHNSGRNICMMMGIPFISSLLMVLSFHLCYGAYTNVRDFQLINLSGCTIDLYSVDDANEVRVLREEAILNATSAAFSSSVGDMHEVIASNCSGVCASHRATFQVNDNFDQIFWVEQGLDIVHEDDMVERSQFRLNGDFSLFYEMNALPGAHVLYDDPRQRYIWQSRLFRRSPLIGGLIENKLLCHSLLVAMGIPKAEVYYGAFATKSLSEWPKYDRDDFIRTLKTTPQVYEDHLFVVKPATGAYTEGVLLMNNRKWEEEDWSLEKLADYVESILDTSESSWDARYEHFGFMVQQNVLPQDTSEDIYSGSFTGDNAVFEFKAHVVFGEVAFTSIIPVPHNIAASLAISFCEGHAELLYATNESGATSRFWETIKPVIQPNRISRIAQRLARAFGADWYRLDIFMDLNGTFLVNEVTYPSAFSTIYDCTFSRLHRMYKSSRFEVVEPLSRLDPLLKRINASYDIFIDHSDYFLVNDTWSEEDWDLYMEEEWDSHFDDDYNDDDAEET